MGAMREGKQGPQGGGIAAAPARTTGPGGNGGSSTSKSDSGCILKVEQNDLLKVG